MNKVNLLLPFLLFISVASYCQSLQLDTSFSAEYLVDKVLVGSGVRVGNVKAIGQKHSIGYFAVDTTVLGMTKGIVLSTGNIFDAANPNINPGMSNISWDVAKYGPYQQDADLNELSAGTTFDHVILEFDFVPFNNFVSFNFLFASEEYPEYVGSLFNDVFAFILTGENIKKQNLALIPGTSEAITINNINHKKNDNLFISNNYFVAKKLTHNTISNPQGYYSNRKKKKLNQYLINNFGFDGLTKVLKASCTLTPWKVYHLKIAIGDVSDAILDSGVFLEAGSLQSVKDSSRGNFENYQDLYDQMNWDSIFGIKRFPANPTYFHEEEKINIKIIHFDSNQFEIPDSSLANLDSIANCMKINTNSDLVITGHTDNIGTPQDNITLSEKRALAVFKYLVQKGIDKSRLKYYSKGLSLPASSNSTEEGKSFNRRVELTIVDKKEK